MELKDRVQLVKSKEDLADFVGMLKSDLARNGATWENATFETFLSAMEHWIKDMDGYYKNSGQSPADPPTWKTFAVILTAATMYE